MPNVFVHPHLTARKHCTEGEEGCRGNVRYAGSARGGARHSSGTGRQIGPRDLTRSSKLSSNSGNW